MSPGLLPARRMNHDSRRLGIPSRFRLFGTRSNRRIAQHFLLNDAPSINLTPLRHSAVNIIRLRSDDHDHGMTTPIAPDDAFMLLLQRKQLDSHRYWAGGHEIPVEPFAKGGMCITHLQRNPRKYFGSPFDMLV